MDLLAKEIIRRRNAGEGPRSISRALGISHNITAGVLWRAGLTVGRGMSRAETLEKRRQERLAEEARIAERRLHNAAYKKSIVTAYRRGAPIAEIAEEFGCDQSYVSRLAKRYDEPSRRLSGYAKP